MRRDGDLESVESQGALADGPLNIGDVAAAHMRCLDELARSGKPAGIASGFRDLDRMTGRFGWSDFVVIAGRPSMGKTALMLNVAEPAATNAIAATIHRWCCSYRWRRLQLPTKVAV